MLKRERPAFRVASVFSTLLLDFDMCIFFKLSSFSLFPFVLGMTARWYYKIEEGRGREKMIGLNGERKWLLENLSAISTHAESFFSSS